MKSRAAAKGRSLFRLAAAALLVSLVLAPQIATAEAAGYPETRDRLTSLSDQVCDQVDGPLSHLPHPGYRPSYDENVVGSLLVPERVNPATYGLKTIAEDQAVLDIWNDTMRWAAKGNNAYTKYLNNPSLKSANLAWNETISPQFLKRIRKAGYDVSEVHHWNWPRSNHLGHVFDARHLVPIPRNRPGLHWGIHGDLTSHPSPNPNMVPPWDTFRNPIRPEHAIDLPGAASLLIAQ